MVRTVKWIQSQFCHAALCISRTVCCEGLVRLVEVSYDVGTGDDCLSDLDQDLAVHRKLDLGQPGKSQIGAALTLPETLT